MLATDFLKMLASYWTWSERKESLAAEKSVQHGARSLSAPFVQTLVLEVGGGAMTRCVFLWGGVGGMMGKLE